MKARKLLTAALVAGLLLTAGAASAFPLFTVTPGVFGGPAGTTFTADNFTGFYREFVTFTPTSASGGSFQASLQFDVGQFANTNPGPGQQAVIPAFVSGVGFNYGLYALFQGGGSYTTTVDGGGNQTTTFVPTNGTLNFYVDPGDPSTAAPSPNTPGTPPNTQFVDPTSGASFFGTTNSADDLLIATGVLVSGSGMQTLPASGICPNQNCGSFGQTTTFSLQGVGPSYFTGPVPFFNIASQTGQFNGFPIAENPSTVLLSGSINVQFIPSAVPEPSSIALFGLALVGLAAVRRRKV